MIFTSLFLSSFIPLLASFSVGECASKALSALPGESAALPGWHMQSVLYDPQDVKILSQPGANISSWYRVSARSTVMSGLLQNAVYSEEDLFYSNHLETKVDTPVFLNPWLYREEFHIRPIAGQHFFLKTNGITSKADIFVNGHLLASRDLQAGSFAGHQFEITRYLLDGDNCVLFKVYPTSYQRDFAIGFIDWNPSPPDNGTGIWRDVEILQTGPISISSPRVVTNFTNPAASHVEITVKVDVVNHEERLVAATLRGEITSEDGKQRIPLSGAMTLKPLEATTATIKVTLSEPRVWWPAFWGAQPLYAVKLNASVNEMLSDAAPTQHFGIRHVASSLNAYNDTAFSVNGRPFLVLGAGYSSDLFLRWDNGYMRNILQYMLNMGLNTIRLEGKQEHPELYEMADRMGMMVLAGWECCDRWEAWPEYAPETNGPAWDDHDYAIANCSMLHEADMMQTHPSMLGFLVGSDFWPDDRVTEIFVNAMREKDWPNPIIASASQQGYPELLGPSGMKMDGPYDWVPPGYWYGDSLGAAFGFGSEQGAGVGTPEIRSLKKFMTKDELHALWTKPSEPLYHMSTNISQFNNRSIYDDALFARYGKPSSLEDYLLKCQMMDYEATRAEFEGFSARRNASRPATGVIYWMLNGAWPSLHWQLFDYYLRPAGAFFGTKVGTRLEHVAYDYAERAIYLINHSLNARGKRTVSIDLIDTNGRRLVQNQVTTTTVPNSSKSLVTVPGVNQIQDVALLKVTLQDPAGTTLSRNVYWLSGQEDVLDWDNSTWYFTPASSYANFSSLANMPSASLRVDLGFPAKESTADRVHVFLENESDVPAFFVRLALIDRESQDEIAPAHWSDNYVTLWPKETLQVIVGVDCSLSDAAVEIIGANVDKQTLQI